MRIITLIMTLLMTFSAAAHTDHVLGDGIVHYLYHITFGVIFAAVVLKIVKFYRAKRAYKQHQTRRR